MSGITKQRLDYAETMRVIGQFLQREGISEVSILEYDKGWIIHGLTFKYTSRGFMRTTIDCLLTHDDIMNLKTEFERRRSDAPKRRWAS